MKRPDPQDHAPAHRACVCGDRNPCTCGTPSPGWRWRTLRSLVPLVFGYLQVAERKLDEILKEIRTMAGQTQAAAAELVKDLHRLADGYAAKDAVIAAKDTEIGELRAALASADADKEAAVAAATDSQDAAGAAAINEADAIVEGLSPEPVADPPADGGDGAAPVDSGDDSAPADGSGDTPAPDAPADGS